MPILIQMVYKQHQKKLFILITIILKTQIVKYLIQVKRSGVFLKKAREILFIQNFTYHQKRINKVSVRTTILCRSIFKQILKPLLWVGEGLSISLTPRQHQKYRHQGSPTSLANTSHHADTSSTLPHHPVTTRSEQFSYH